MNDVLTDDRFTVPMYTVTEASELVDVRRSTLDAWAHGYVRDRPGQVGTGAPVITALLPARKGYPTIPFGGLAEAYVLNAFRGAGVPLQRIRPSLDWLTSHIGPHALASRHLRTDGAEVLWDFGHQDGEFAADAGAVADALVMVPRSGQYVFQPAIDQYLRRVAFDDGDFASAIRLPRYGDVGVVVDPRRSFGRPYFLNGGARVEDVLGPVRAGDPIEDVARDHGVPLDDLRDALALSA